MIKLFVGLALCSLSLTALARTASGFRVLTSSEVYAIEGSQTPAPAETHREHKCQPALGQRQCNAANSGVSNCSGFGSQCLTCDGYTNEEVWECKNTGVKSDVCTEAPVTAGECGNKKAGTCDYDDNLEEWYCSFGEGATQGKCRNEPEKKCNGPA